MKDRQLRDILWPTGRWILLGLVLVGCASAPAPQPATTTPEPTEPQPPVAERVAHVESIDGVELSDDYFWLRERDNPDVIAYLEAENAYTEAMMGHTEDLQEALYEEMLSRIQETDLSVPYRRDDYWYYSRTEEGEDYPIFCRRHGSQEAPEEVLLDENALAEGHEYFDIGILEVSPDHNLLAYGVDTSGAEKYTVYFKDLGTGEQYEETLEDISYSLEWANDDRTVLYTQEDEAYRPYQLYRYELGDDPEAAELVYQEDDERFFLDVSRTRSGAYLVMQLDSAVTSERWVLDADEPQGAFRVVQPREQGVEYQLEHHSDRFYIVTNRGEGGESAINFRLMETPVESPGAESWTEIIPHRLDVQLVGVDAFADYLVIHERREGLPTIRIRALATGDEHAVAFPEPVYSVEPEDNPEFDSQTFRINYTSLVTPESIFDYHMDTREMELLKETPVLGGYDRADYVSERLFATAEDGAQVPISVVYRRGLPHDGSNPMLLMGYGAYGYPYDPYFSASRLSLLDRGFVYGIAHVRGGGEMGRPWYEDGKLLNKRNTFTDFIACAEHVIAEGLTSSDRLAIYGASAGGLLIGAVLNMRPDLFRVVVADVPFVDLINTMMDASIPLTVIEWEEWGDPHEPEFFDYMLSYSPYDNVAAVDYPHILVFAGLNDPRVQYWEPAKWTARIRSMRTDDDWLLLQTNMDAGHFGASGRYGRLRETAFMYAFILDRLGL